MGLAVQLSGALGCCGGSQPWAVPRCLGTCGQQRGLPCWLAASASGITVRAGDKRTWGVAMMTATSAVPSISCSCRPGAASEQSTWWGSRYGMQ